MQRLRRSALALIVVLLVASCGQKPDAKTVAQHFFDTVASGKTEEAHREAGFAFQAEQNLRTFDQAAKESGLVGAKGVRLEPRESEGKTVKFDAVVTTPTGEERTYIVSLQEEGGTWKVFSLQTPRDRATGLRENRFSIVGKGVAFSDAIAQPMPDEKTMMRLISSTMRSFNDSLRQQSFAGFYQNVSAAWQAQVTERQLQRAFQPFIDRGVDLTGVLRLDPVIDVQPQITTDGLLLLTGHYPSKPYEVEFSFKYIYELPEWKLFGIDVNMRKAKETKETKE